MDESLRKLLTTGASELGVTLDEAAVAYFSTFLDLLQRWGSRMNLTSRLGAEEIVIYHFLDSLAGATLLASSRNARMVDLGTGAGLPSFPLKFALPGLHVLLVESVRKKVSFCQEVIRATRVSGIEVAWGRSEKIGSNPEHRHAFDWAVSRALGKSADVAALARPFLAPGGSVLIYKGKKDVAEQRALDEFCSRHGATVTVRRISVPHVRGARSLITVNFQNG